jgi:hypothetical protein
MLIVAHAAACSRHASTVEEAQIAILGQQRCKLQSLPILAAANAAWLAARSGR